METIRKIFEAIGKVTTMLMAIVIGIYMARFLPLWLGGIIAVCAFVVLVIRQIEEQLWQETMMRPILMA